VEYKRAILNFSYVLPGLLAGMAKPGHLEPLQEDLVFLRSEGIKAILSLSETGLDEDLLQEEGFDYLHIPIADFTAPTLEQVEQGMEFIERMMKEKKPVAVHCGAGCGRTGTFLACYFIKKGKTSEEAIGHVRSLRPCSIETASQRELVYQYGEQLKKRRER
jgi:atypical dual specificity phosphatase